ncbi:transposase, MuDR, MULE transposase domain protein [Artemisia annua]|uniref:Transposase, MuDR, MULE transposase domain protein n=1 Tax=Artemisia annua TaxID=35608 RepID=A0A2U1KYV2_ARTAN|nr:transposase, MuDR, MULE transposase domain protein [Artemisia annua]
MCKSYLPEVFNKTLAELRAKRPEVVKKLEQAGFDKWSRAYCKGKRYNYLTSNSAESINSLTRHVQKAPITMLMEYYRRLLQDWYCKRREKYHDAHEFELAEWAARKVKYRMLKSATSEVRGIAMWLKECIGEVPDLAIISDRHAAITQACDTVFPNCFHGYCCRHLMMNCNLKKEKINYLPEVFNKTLAELRAKRPEVVKKLEQAGFDKWSRAYCKGKRYNYLTSNSAESINSLTRHVQKAPITMLMEYYRRLLQDWYCKRREKYHDAHEFELAEWAARKVKYRMLKSATSEVRGIAMQWQLSGLPCGHVCAVCRVENLTNCNKWARTWFRKTALKGTYREMVFPFDEEANWHNPGNLQKVKPLLMIKNQSGRPKDKKMYSIKKRGAKSYKLWKEKNKTNNSRTDKGKEVMQEVTTENENRKRKSNSEHQLNVEHNTEDELCWMGEPSNRISDGDLLWGGDLVWSGNNLNSNPVSSTHYQTSLMGEPSNRFGEGSVLWGGQAATSSVNLHSQHESSNHYQSNWMGEPSTRIWDRGMVWGGEAANSTINLLTNPESTNPYHLDDF